MKCSRFLNLAGGTGIRPSSGFYGTFFFLGWEESDKLESDLSVQSVTDEVHKGKNS
jgi:hypothetical protein